MRVRLLSAGKEYHHAQLVRLEGNKTVLDLRAWIEEGGPERLGHEPPWWLTWMGGPAGPDMGAESSVTVALTPGTYAWLCLVTTAPPEGTPHFKKGMLRAMTVTGRGRPRLPQGDVLLMLSDYDFKFSRPLTSGRQTIRVRNMASQTHEVLFLRLHPGRTKDDLLAWLSTFEGPPPFQALGGTVGLDNGEVNLVDLDLTAGAYAMICFVPDRGDGKPHYRHGMIKSFTVS